MSLELIYTSAPRGLIPTASGFCTVAATGGMSRQVLATLEGLSGYQFHFNLSDANADLNPVNFAHTRVKIGSETRSVLSRIAFAGADYSGRTNKIAHHVLLERGEQMANGPAWMMLAMARSVFVAGWDAEPRHLDKRSIASMLSAEPRAAEPATTWQAATGDAGWAGALVQAFRTSPKVPAYVVYEPGQDLLPLFEESLAILPPEQRWQVAFATYYTTLPAGCHYHWRGVLAGSRAAQEMRRFPNATVIDLTSALGPAADGPFAEAARTGGVLPSREPARPQKKVRIKGRREPKRPAEPVATTVAEEADQWSWDEATPAQGYTPPPPREPARRRSAAVPALVTTVAVLAALLAVSVFFNVTHWPSSTSRPAEGQRSEVPRQGTEGAGGKSTHGPAAGTVPSESQTPSEKPAERQSQAPASQTETRTASEGSEVGGDQAGTTKHTEDIDEGGSSGTTGGEETPAPTADSGKTKPTPAEKPDGGGKAREAENPPQEEYTVKIASWPLTRTEGEIASAQSGGWLTPEKAASGARAWTFRLGRPQTIQFFQYPWSLSGKTREDPWFVKLEASPNGCGIKVPSEAASGSELIKCNIKTRSGNAVLVCEIDEGVRRQKDFQSYADWLVVEFEDETGAIRQCVFNEDLRSNTKEMIVGYNGSGVRYPKQDTEILRYPWPETLVVEVEGRKPQPVIGRALQIEGKKKFSEGERTVPYAVTVSLTFEHTTKKDECDLVKAVFKIPTLDNLEELADAPIAVKQKSLSRSSLWNKCTAQIETANAQLNDKKKENDAGAKQSLRDNKNARDKLEEPITLRMKAIEDFVKEHGTVRIRDAWGLPIATIELKFRLDCGAGKLIKAVGDKKRRK